MAVFQRDNVGSNDENAKLGVGIIGTGGIAHVHAASIKGNPYTEVVGLCDIKDGVAESFGRRLGFDVPIFADYHELLTMDGLDAVIVATSNDAHAPAAIAAVEAGKHTLCEKPMSNSFADAKAMVAAEERASVCTMIGYSKRFFRGTRFLYDYLRREELGRVFSVRAFYLQGHLSNPEYPMAWRMQREKTGTGSLGDLAAHVTDLAQHLLGDDITRVTGMLKTFVDKRPSMIDPGKKESVDVDDACMFWAEFKTGAMGTFESSRNATGRPDHWRIEIDAEDAALIYDNTDQKVLVSVRTGPTRLARWIELPIPRRYGPIVSEFQIEFNHFVDCIRSGGTPVPSFAEAMKTERVLDAVVRSSETGMAVDI